MIPMSTVKAKTKVPSLSDYQRWVQRRDAFEARVREVLDDHETLALDNEDDKETLVAALVSKLGPK